MIGGPGEMLLDVITNKITWRDHVATILQLLSFLDPTLVEHMYDLSTLSGIWIVE